MSNLVINIVKPANEASCGYTIRYRKFGTNDAYITTSLLPVEISSTVLRFTIDVDDTITNYEGFIKTNCDRLRCSDWVYFRTNNNTNTVWVSDNFVCEQDTLIDVGEEYTGYSSPGIVHYYNGFIYVMDQDSTEGFVYKFLPEDADDLNHITTANNITYFKGSDNAMKRTTTNVLYVTSLDVDNNRFIGTGNAYGGLVVFDIPTEKYIIPGTGIDDSTYTYNNNLAYGSNAVFSRLNTVITKDYIYASDRNSSKVHVWNKNDFTIINSGTSLVPNTDLADVFFDGVTGVQIGNEVWFVAGNNDKNVNNIYRFSTNLLTQPYPKIPIPDCVRTLFNSRYFITMYYDNISDKVYIGTWGNLTTGNNMHIYNVSNLTNVTLIKTINFTQIKGAKKAATTSIVKDPFSNELFIAYQGTNTETSSIDSSPENRLYIIDRNSNDITNVLYKPAPINLSYQPGTNPVTLWGCSTGLRSWEGGSSGNDGKIIKYVR